MVDVVAIRGSLLHWYDTGRRDLPWRRSRDPYHIWVSEIMLQQTRVEAVLPYYQRWVARYPDVHALADADLQDVLKAWEGLGYYSRARNLHRAAQMVREHCNGHPPRTYEALRALPGVGDYTAGAIASIAFDEPRPAVDGNVRRVLSRLYDVPAPTAASVRAHAQELLDRARPGDFNQALMELGATVCTPRKPACARCPLHSSCRARANGTQLERPGRKPGREIPHEHVTVLIVQEAERVLLSQRPATGLLAHMWEFPQAARVPANARHLGDVTHTFSHKRVTYRVYRAARSRRPRKNETWVAFSDLHAYPLPRAQRTIEQLLHTSNVGFAPPGGVRRAARP